MGGAPRFTSRFEIDQDARVSVVSLGGTFDPGAVDDLHPQVQELVRAGIKHFVFDLEKVEHIGSLGLRLLVGLASQLKDGGSVGVCAPPAGVRSVFEMTKLNQIVRTFPSRADAVGAARGS